MLTRCRSTTYRAVRMIPMNQKILWHMTLKTFQTFVIAACKVWNLCQKEAAISLIRVWTKLINSWSYDYTEFCRRLVQWWILLWYLFVDARRRFIVMLHISCLRHGAWYHQVTVYRHRTDLLFDYQSVWNRARKSRTTLQNKVRLKVLPEQLTLFVNTSVTFKKCIIL